MRAEAAEAERRFEVREAARGWHRAGAIGEATRAAIEAAYPDDRARLGPVFRVLVFGFAVVAVNALFGLFGLFMAEAFTRSNGVPLMLFGLVLVGATELQVGSLRRAQGGTEAATAFLGLCYLLGGMLWLVESARLGEAAWMNLALVLVVVLCAAAAYRWGYVLFAAAAAFALFPLLARGAWGRVAWVIVPVVLAPALRRAGDSARLPPSHRRACQAVAVVCLVFLYLAVHLGSWDVGLVEALTGEGRASRAPAPFRPIFAMATALVPVLTLAWGIGAHRRLLISLGLVGLLVSIVTLRFYVHVAPLWAALLVGGASALGLALALRRYLDAGPGHERHGFTAEPLFADPERRSALEVAASVASLSPAARAVERPGFQGGGGRSGGGGATGNF
ncbi:MAG: hypothetical protein DMF79_01200 [Acidobacteria bacterium]|nr:MAG: hypothetical protein DMF79_01200 [Acidobacteriota bacterium]